MPGEMFQELHSIKGLVDRMGAADARVKAALDGEFPGYEVVGVHLNARGVVELAAVVPQAEPPQPSAVPGPESYGWYAAMKKRAGELYADRGGKL